MRACISRVGFAIAGGPVQSLIRTAKVSALNLFLCSGTLGLDDNFLYFVSHLTRRAVLLLSSL
jgi:hypothetical protein